MSDTLDVGTLSGRIELEDRLGPSVAEISSKLDLLNEKMSKTHTGAVEVAEGMFGAEAAMAAAHKAVELVTEGFKELFDIAVEGSHAKDIEETFHRLTEQAGLTADTLKGKMSVALRGTVDDSDLMIRVNQNLAAGLKLTEGQTETLAKGAFALAKATGGDAKEALDKLSDAMVTGRTRSIALLTGKIDLSAAEDKFAAKLGVTTDHLSEQGKQAAIQETILDKVAEATSRVGDQQVRLADELQQADVWWKNTKEQIGIAINDSPVLKAGFDAIKDALTGAFGGDQSQLIKTVIDYINDAAIGVVGLAEYVTDAVGVIGVEWNAAIVVFDSVKAGWDAIGYAGEGALLAIMKGLNAVSFGAFDEDVRILSEDVDGWYNAMAENQKGIEEHKKAEDDWAVSTGNVKDKIEAVRQKMIEAKQSTAEETDATHASASAHTEGAAAAAGHAAAEQNVGLTIGYTKDQMKLYTEALKEMAGVSGDSKAVLDSVSGSVVEAVKYYLEAGISLDKLTAAYGLSDAQAKKIEEDWKSGNETLKTTIKVIDDLSKSWSDYFMGLATMNASDVQMTKLSALAKYEATIKSLQEAGDGNVKHYDEAWDLYQRDVDKNQQALILKDSNSKASLLKQIQDSKDLLQFKLDHSDQYTADDIDNTRKQIAALQAVRDAWGGVGTSIEKDTEKVRTLSGEVLTLKEYEQRQSIGGSFDVTSQNFSQTAMGLNLDLGRATTLAHQGYSLGEIQAILQNTGNGPIPPPHGPRIPGFKEGGVGDFGAGTLAMLHGREAIVPLDRDGALGGDTFVFNVNGTAEESARQIMDIMMKRAKKTRYFGTA